MQCAAEGVRQIHDEKEPPTFRKFGKFGFLRSKKFVHPFKIEVARAFAFPSLPGCRSTGHRLLLVGEQTA